MNRRSDARPPRPDHRDRDRDRDRGRDREWTDAQPHGAVHVGRLGRVLDRLLDAYARAEAGTPADRAVRDVLRGARDLGPSERAEIRDGLFGLFRMRRRIREAVERAAAAERRNLDPVDTPMRQRLDVLAYLALNGASLAELERLDPRATKRIPRLFERLCRGRWTPKKRAPVDALAVETSLPTWIVRRLADSFSLERAALIAHALNARAPVTVRVKKGIDRERLRIRFHEERELTATDTELSPYGLCLDRTADLRGFEPFEAGQLELQDEGSQLVVLACGSAPGDRVLDACAGAGGKTLALAAELEGSPGLTAMDPDPRKLRELGRRASRLSAVPPIQVHPGELEELPDSMKGLFDVVLVDAPCTGTGTLRRAPDLAWRLSESDVPHHTARQLRLLTTASGAVKPGGRLIYATCSVFHEENEGVSHAFLESEPRFQPRALARAWGKALSTRLGATHETRIGPGPGPTGPDGFYVACFERR